MTSRWKASRRPARHARRVRFGRLEIDQGFVQPDLEDPRDDVLAPLMTDLTPRIKPADSYLPRRPRQDFERHLPALVAGEILIVVVRRPGEATLNQNSVVTATLRARPLGDMLDLLARHSHAPSSRLQTWNHRSLDHLILTRFVAYGPTHRATSSSPAWRTVSVRSAPSPPNATRVLSAPHSNTSSETACRAIGD